MCAPLVFLILGIASTSAAEPPGGYYTTRYDHIDVENILNQKRLVHYYSECLLDRGPCTPQGIEFKRILPEALKTNCIRCTEKQLFVTVKSIRRLKKEYPEVWSQLAEIWDPTGDYFKRLEAKLANFKNHNENSVEASNVQENVLLVNRLGEDEPDPVAQVVPANTVAGKPISFSTTTIKASTSKKVATTVKPVVKTTTRIDLFATNKVVYNYDFAATSRPVFVPRPGSINLVIRDIITPITDIAGKVIVAGTDIAGMVLNVLGIRPVIMATATTT